MRGQTTACAAPHAPIHLIRRGTTEVVESKTCRPLHLEPYPVESQVAQGLEPARAHYWHAILAIAGEVGQGHPAVAANVLFVAPQGSEAYEGG